MLKKILLFILLASVLVGCAPKSQFANVRNLHAGYGANVIFFGDSLTSGSGAGPGEDYVSLIKNQIDLPTINAGIPGDTTASALQRLDRDVLQKDPRIVVVELGGNDYIVSARSSLAARNQAFENLGQIIGKIQDTGAVAVVAGIAPDGDFKDRYRKLAQEKRAALIPDILDGVLENPSLMADPMHPNARGYVVVADNILAVLKPLLNEML